MKFQYRLIVSGCSSAHSIIINMDRKALSFGRNQFGQLGQPEAKCYELPTLIPGLEHVNIIQAACGRNHSLFLTDTGTVYACGDNKNGQCGVGNSNPTVMTPTRINYRGPPIIKVGCGAEFSVILDIKGNLHSFGLPEYGQLGKWFVTHSSVFRSITKKSNNLFFIHLFHICSGHNTDGKYFVNSNKMTFHFETSPKRIVLYIEKSKDGHVTPIDGVQIVDFSCGNNHTVRQSNRLYSHFTELTFQIHLKRSTGCHWLQEAGIQLGLWRVWSFGPCGTKGRNGSTLNEVFRFVCSRCSQRLLRCHIQFGYHRCGCPVLVWTE